ncbi:hypothetical protein FKM82_024300 [Ascaphus truei]
MREGTTLREGWGGYNGVYPRHKRSGGRETRCYKERQVMSRANAGGDAEHRSPAEKPQDPLCLETILKERRRHV